ncbi:hypothetical protein [Rhizobium sp. NPDC090279]|uniref:hypothetical protein n=1 Tax=Rhizobium sp. NPDC090279 TaxID=3364499 RepID=UPI00383A8244
MGYRSILARLTAVERVALVGARHQLRRFGVLLREAAAIAFAMRCKVIDRR